MRIGSQETMPLTYVENCAEAIVMAAKSESAIGQTLNVVNDDLPTQKDYAQKIQQVMTSPPSSIAISWSLMRSVAQTAFLSAST